MYVLFRNSPSFSAKTTDVTPAWMWPQGCSIRQRATRAGAMSCDGLKNDALAREDWVMLGVFVAVDEVSAAQAAEFGIWLVSVKKAPNGPAKLGFGFSAAIASDCPLGSGKG